MDELSELKSMIQEAANRELDEIFGLFGNPGKKNGKGSTEKIAPEPGSQTPIQVQTFSLETLKQLKTSKETREYVRRTLEKLGQGQARAAYALDDSTILKLALSDNKTYQNKNEVENAKCLGPSFAVQVLDFHPEYTWIVEERVNPIGKGEIVHKINQLTDLGATQLKFKSPQDIQEFFTNLPTMLGTDFSQFESQRNDFMVMGLLNHAERHMLMIKQQNEWYMEFSSKMIGCKFASWDFHAANWGIRPSTGDLVLLDLGFSRTEASPEEKFFKEFIVRILKEELNNHSKFNLEHLRTLKNLHDILDYCFDTLGKPNKGAARFAWNLNDSQVLKVVRELKYVDQNQQELKNIECVGERFAVKVYDFDKFNQFWIIEERVEAYPEAYDNPKFIEKMNSILGTNYDDWFPIMGLFAIQGYDETKEKLLKTNAWFQNIVKALEDCDVGTEDLHPGNWGIRPSTGELVILDLGF